MVKFVQQIGLWRMHNIKHGVLRKEHLLFSSIAPRKFTYLNEKFRQYRWENDVSENNVKRSLLART